MRRLNKAGILLLLLGNLPVQAEQIRIAVASNFAEVMRELAQRFEHNSGHTLLISTGSTGKHYAQIINGAPFDIFFAADVQRPALLEANGPGITNTRFTYAIGKLVLWSPQASYVDADGQVLNSPDYRHLAIANPRLAPYGKAAQQVLEARKLWPAITARLVQGENIGQTFQFVKSGNAELGFVAYAQVKRPGQPLTGSYWLVPQSLYTPIEQQAILLRDSVAARSFIQYVQTTPALQLIRDYGYDTP